MNLQLPLRAPKITTFHRWVDIILCLFACALCAAITSCGGNPPADSGPAAAPASYASPLDASAQAARGTGLGGTLSPNDLRTHYNMPAQYIGSKQTIVIVDAPGSANVASDLNTFSSYYKLPQCNASNPCFQLIDLSAGARVSPTNDWAIEIALDVEWAHAIAPAATIVLVQARSSSMNDLFAALKVAVSQPNVVAVSMSWGATEYSAETSSLYDGFFSNYPNIAFFAAAGDSGNNGSNQIYPAASPYVTAVGGTSINSLTLPTMANTEVAWAYGGGGASHFEPMPTWQFSFLTATGDSKVLNLNNGKRAIPDVAYNADPYTSPVAVYAKGGWYGVGGTSAGAPQWAAIVANFGHYLAGKGTSVARTLSPSRGLNGLLYQTKLDQATNSAFFDVTAGSDNTSSKPCALCSASIGYDDTTGSGVPNVANLFAHF